VVAGRKQEIVKLTEQLLTAIATSDFESYTYESRQSTLSGTVGCLLMSMHGKIEEEKLSKK